MVYLANSDPLIYENMKQDWNGFQSQMLHKSYRLWDVSTGVTGPTAVAPTFSDILTLFQPGGGADSANHWRGRTYIFTVVTSLQNINSLAI